MSRQSSVSQSNAYTRITVGSRSQLQAAPGATVQIYFDVTNLRSEPVYHNFQVVDEKSYLRSLQPLNSLINPSQTLTVTVVAIIPANVDIGTRNQITFTTTGVGAASASAYLTATSANGNQDSTRPYIDWRYGARCEGRRTDAGQCSGYVWTLELTVRDEETGLLRIDSVPTGVYYRSAFTAGSRDSVSATYAASCCQPRVTITAYDVAGNQRSESFDVTNIYLDAAGISAIVLGVLLLIILIILLILCIRWCVRKRQSRELPVYRTERA